jgi:hypothetical protein
MVLDFCFERQNFFEWNKTHKFSMYSKKSLDHQFDH